MVSLHRATASAVTPDQLIPYVAAVSDPVTSLAGSCLLHLYGRQAVLIAYPLHNPLDAEAADEAVDAALRLPAISRITVLSAARPRQAPPDAVSTQDYYWQIPLPCPAPRAKLRNTLKRAASVVNIEMAAGAAAWTSEHECLARTFIQNKPELDAGSRYLFAKIPDYLAAAPDATLFSARHKADDSLAALAIGDYSPLFTAFYMFAFRSLSAPPGTADLLLQKLAQEGASRGHERLNLGLGINSGIEFFKKKWQAQKFLPLVETGWNIKRAPKKGFFARLFGAR